MSTYKKNIIVISLSLILIMIPSSVFAADSFSKSDFSSDIDVKSISKEIVDFINSCCSEEIGREINESDIDFSKVYKIYIDTNLFNESTSNFNDAVKLLEEKGYLYEIPITIKNATYVAVISKGRPVTNESRETLTEQEIAELEKIEGKWNVEGINVYYSDSPFIDYYATAEKVAGISGTEPILVRDLPGFMAAVALYPDEKGNIGTLVATAPDSVDWQIFSEKNHDGKNTALDYVQIKDIVNKLISENPDETGGGDYGTIVEKTSVNIWYILVAAIILIGSIVIVTRIKRKESKS